VSIDEDLSLITEILPNSIPTDLTQTTVDQNSSISTTLSLANIDVLSNAITLQILLVICAETTETAEGGGVAGAADCVGLLGEACCGGKRGGGEKSHGDESEDDLCQFGG
jgi:hypothetical protein